MNYCSNNFGDNYLFNDQSDQLRQEYSDAELDRRRRIEELKKKAKMHDDQYNLNLLGVNNDDFVASNGVLNVKKYNIALHKNYDLNNPFLTQGKQIVISTKGMETVELDRV